MRIKDSRGKGATQVWFGAGTSLQDREAILISAKGKYRSLSVQRVQPLGDRLSLTAGLARDWYDTGADEYRGTSARIGLAFTGWPGLLKKAIR